jgi:hypothetical protein
MAELRVSFGPLPWAPSRRVTLVSVAALVVGMVSGLTALRPTWDRPVLAALSAFSICAVALRCPREAVAAAMVVLPFLGLVRRGLIPIAGWSTSDPLLLVAPCLSLFLIGRLFLQRRPFTGDLLSNLILALVVLTVLEVANPEGGGVLVGITGLLFLGAPLLWFFIGQQLVDRQLVTNLLPILMIVSVVIGFYGLWQTSAGLPPWDAQWLQVNGYAALNVAGVTRAFGTLASSAEYAAYLAIGVVLSAVWVTHGRALAFIAIPPLALALFLDSSRGIVIFAFFALLLLAGMRTGSARFTFAIVVLGVTGVVAVNQAIGSSLSTGAKHSGSALLAHQVGGLTNPFNADQSTLVLHEQIVINGMLNSLSHPLGLGTGATSLASDHASSINRLGVAPPPTSTEVDASNAFVSLGVVGGFLFLAIVVVTFRRVGQLCLRTRDRAPLAVMGLLVVSLGQWLNGGYYAIAPLLWLLVGWSNRVWLERHADDGLVVEVTTARRHPQPGLGP